jgi:hypothetical protein
MPTSQEIGTCRVARSGRRVFPGRYPMSGTGEGDGTRRLADMAAIALLPSTRIEVEPGSEASCEVLVRNTGDIVDQFTVEVLGAAEGWARAEPPAVNLLPGAEVPVRVFFAPPRSPEVLAGSVAFGIRVASREDPHGSVVEEGEIEVGPFTDTRAELVPTKARGSRRARFRLAVDNFGNVPVAAEIVALDEEDELRLLVDPPTILAEPGTATLVRVKVEPHRRFLRGEPKQRPFQLVTLPDGADPITSNGVLNQQPLLPAWALPLLAMLVALVAVLLALWFTLLKPTVTSIAQTVSQQGASQAATAAKQASQAASQASQAAGVAQAASGGAPAGGAAGGGGASSAAKGGGSGAGSSPGGASTAGSGGGTSSGAAVVAGPTPTDFRIATSATAVTNGSFQTFSYTPPAGQTLDIGDLVLQNPRGDSGILQLVIGNTVVLQEGLANFRDLDYHYVDALNVAAGEAVQVQVSCTAPGAGMSTCTPSVSFSGQLRKG